MSERLSLSWTKRGGEIKSQNRGLLLEEADLHSIVNMTLLKSQFICGSKHQLSSQVVVCCLVTK